MRRFLLSLLWLIPATLTHAQAEMFAPGVISNDKVFGLTLSPNGREAFFVASGGGRDTMQLHTSTLVRGQCSAPKPWRWADLSQKQIDPSFSPDGNTLLLNISGPGTRSFDIYQSRRTDTGWSRPEPVPGINSDSSDFFATMTRTGTIYFTRRTTGRNVICRSRTVNGIYTEPEPLDSTINSGFQGATNPFVDPDERYIIFLGQGKADYGNGDLYISFQTGAQWSAPENLGPLVNTAAAEFCPMVHARSGYFYFARTIPNTTTGKRVENIWRIRLKKLEALRR